MPVLTRVFFEHGENNFTHDPMRIRMTEPEFRSRFIPRVGAANTADTDTLVQLARAMGYSISEGEPVMLPTPEEKAEADAQKEMEEERARAIRLQDQENIRKRRQRQSYAVVLQAADTTRTILKEGRLVELAPFLQQTYGVGGNLDVDTYETVNAQLKKLPGNVYIMTSENARKPPRTWQERMMQSIP